MLPFVTRSHHDSEVGELRTEVEELVAELIAVCNDLTLTKQTLRDCIDKLKNAEERANHAFRFAAQRNAFDYKVPIYETALRFHLSEPHKFDCSYPANRFRMTLEPYCVEFALDPRELRRDIPYVIDHVAGLWGHEYGNYIQQKVRELLTQHMVKRRA